MTVCHKTRSEVLKTKLSCTGTRKLASLPGVRFFAQTMNASPEMKDESR